VLVILGSNYAGYIGYFKCGFSLPMLVAVLHNAVALGLLLSLLGLAHKVYKNQ
jgi:hypothetical protein